MATKKEIKNRLDELQMNLLQSGAAREVVTKNEITFVTDLANSCRVDRNGDTPLAQLCIIGRSGLRDECVDRLLSLGADPTATNLVGQTALFYADTNTSRKLVEAVPVEQRQAFINHQNDRGETALHQTIHEDKARALLDLGANPDIVDRQGRTADDDDYAHRPEIKELISATRAERDRQALRDHIGLTDDQKPIQHSRRM